MKRIVLGAVLSSSIVPLVTPALLRAQWTTDGAPVCTASLNQMFPSATPAAAGGMIVAWHDERHSTNGDIYAQRLSSSGVPQWAPNGVPVCSTSAHHLDPIVVPDAQGGAMVFWTEHSGTYDVRVQRVDAAGTVQWPTAGVPVSTGSFDDFVAGVISNGASGVVDPIAYLVAVVERPPTSSWRVRLQRVDLTGGGQWSPLGVAVSESPREKYGVALASDGVGLPGSPKGAVLVWSESHPFTSMNIMARRVDASGTPQWLADGNGICTFIGSQSEPHIANVGGDKTVVAWQDARTGGQHDIFAQRLDSAGTALWASSGTPVCTAEHDQITPKVVFGGSGTAIVVWHDFRESESRLFAQKLDANGLLLWDDDGVAFTSAAQAIDIAGLVSDGAGGVIAAWEEIRNGSTDLIAQRVAADGSLLWGPEGVPFCAAAGGQSDPVLVSDGANGALAAWSDDRNGPADIFASRILGGGGVVDAPALTGVGAAASAYRFRVASANPSRGTMRFAVSLPRPEAVAIEVVDVAGRRVRTIPGTGTLEAGEHSLRWDGTDSLGAAVAAGTYFVRMSAGRTTQTQRVVVLR